ncbi:Flp family type IVb pilin [Salinarimonas soli]|uniref:Flp family type IVb pilin n=1 Tax=Salinarimonas soli TaxID=1638099 RepID=A0A5B2VCY1_9HYPH|nr:Flp family type IVb pilin [Salinarimonas soli]KAA2236605.1 Flp family type IVb pilin [Salinarimonas soli]
MTKAFIRCESGATSIEYAFMAMVVALVIIVATTSMGESTRARLESVKAGFTN